MIHVDKNGPNRFGQRFYFGIIGQNNIVANAVEFAKFMRLRRQSQVSASYWGSIRPDQDQQRLW